MKYIRLQENLNKSTLDTLLALYKEVKQTHDINKIVAFKSFIAKAVEAQYEVNFNFGGHIEKRWASLNEYVPNVIMGGAYWTYGINSPLEYIYFVVDKASPFGYKKERDFNRTL